MSVFKALIVDDEARARRTLRRLIEGFCEGVEILDAVGSVDDAIEVLRAKQVDVVFLDISMPGKNGFALAKMPEFADLSIVFITAHSEYAVEAFRVKAVDYLLKPVDITELRETINRLRQQTPTEPVEKQTALRFFANGEHHFVQLSDLVHLEADGSYTYVITENQRLMVSKPIGELGEDLKNKGFFRVHRSFIINLQHLKSIGPISSPFVTMNNGSKIPLSRYRRPELMSRISSPTK